MDNVPDDILILVFEKFTSFFELDQSPTLLLPICRRWRNLILATPSLWASVKLRVTSMKDAKRVLAKAGQGHGLEAYLRRSDPQLSTSQRMGDSFGVGLHIHLIWTSATKGLTDEEHLHTCNVSPLSPFACPSSICQLIPERQRLFIRLVEIVAGKYRPGFEGKASRLARWESLRIAAGGIFSQIWPPSELHLFPQTTLADRVVIPRLERLCMVLSSGLEFKAPSLRHLELRGAWIPSTANLEGVETLLIVATTSRYSLEFPSLINVTTLKIQGDSVLVKAITREIRNPNFDQHAFLPRLRHLVFLSAPPNDTLVALRHIFDDRRTLETMSVTVDIEIDTQFFDALTARLLDGTCPRIQTLVLMSWRIVKAKEVDGRVDWDGIRQWTLPSTFYLDKLGKALDAAVAKGIVLKLPEDPYIQRAVEAAKEGAKQ
ncbi:SubName: Full=Uncharacterized protein {ECO:0000313/EMBL:CCA74610.1} [Serendipita indica DSM 11827]|uniref:Uncharacterized protein n=1 Tax=Serendipita indica (strain DSM 11827) TaxID=1109443 RepID=G4TTG7_SERID|nr:SubName: Full=Uncharacterized protein {ECO:0000313/EMBL:CCA74610.1} [Serendipita indica DSM 11827]CCA74610.1 hypothetical protein PIIN_08562 [Serendipita indica DSM 11827]